MNIHIEFCEKWNYHPDFDRVSKLIKKIAPTAKIEGNTNIRCPNEECISIQESKQSSVTYIKYDSEDMKYIYICNYCGQKWKNS